MTTDVSPAHILQIGMGVELGVFTELTSGAKTGPDLERALKLHPRATYDFLDALVALGLLARSGTGPAGRYANTPETAKFLDRNSPAYVGGLLEMSNSRLYRFWGDLTEALRTGKPQNEVKHSGKAMFDELYADPARLSQFMDAMRGASAANFAAYAEKFDFARYKTMADIGGATGQLSCFVAARHPHMKCRSFDLPVVKPIAARRIKERGADAQVQAEVIDFFKDEFPQADVITMGMVLHDWNLETKKMLIGKAYRALPDGGVFVAIEHLIDDERRQNAFGLLMSLNMLIELGDAFDFTGADFAGWCREAGFKRIEVLPLAGPAGAGIAYK
jgi:hypothetical protein